MIYIYIYIRYLETITQEKLESLLGKKMIILSEKSHPKFGCCYEMRYATLRWTLPTQVYMLDWLGNCLV